MAIDVEDGTGKPSAQSLVSVTEAQAYATARGWSVGWSVVDNIEKALVRSGDYLIARRYRWRGTVVNPDQRMPFPRVGVVSRDGRVYSGAVVPTPIKEAQIELANLILSSGIDVFETLKNGGLLVSSKNVSASGISTSYMAPTSFFDRGAAETVFTAVEGKLWSFADGQEEVPLISSGGMDSVPTVFDVGVNDNVG